MQTPFSKPHTSATPVELRDGPFALGTGGIWGVLGLAVPRGKVTALMGASGGGKTQVLRLIGGQNRAQSGSLTFEGEEVGSMNRTEVYTIGRPHGILFQFVALLHNLSEFYWEAFPFRDHKP